MKNKKLLSITRQFFLTIIFFLLIGVLFAQTPIINSAEFYDELNNTTYCPTEQDIIESFEETIELRTKMLFAPHDNWKDIYVEVTNSFEDENGNPQVESYNRNNRLTDNPCPINPPHYIIVPGIVDDCGLIHDIPLSINLHYGLNTITFEAWFDPDNKFPSPCVLNVVRPKPEVIGHIYASPDPPIIPEVPIELFNDFIEFKTFLTYNDNVNYNDSVKVRIYRQINDQTPVAVDSAVGITQQSNTTITIPADNDYFKVELDPFYNDSIKVFFKAWFIRDGQEFDYYNTQDTSMLRIYHPAPKVGSVSFVEIDPISIEPGQQIMLYNDSIYFRAHVEYNDFLSVNEDICVEVFRVFEQDTISHGLYTGETQGDPNNTLTIDDNGEKIKVTLGSHGLDYGINEIFLRSWFCDFTTDTVTSQSIIIDHPKPVVDSIVFYDFIPGQLSSCLNVTKEIYNPEVKFGLRVYYNDSLSKDETIKLELHHTKNGVVDTLKFTKNTNGDENVNPPFIEFPIDTIGPFNLGPNDFDSTKFRAYAWFEEDFTEPEDHKASDDSLMLVYRVNTKPKLVITTLYDSIFTNNNLKIKGVVIDTTGYLDKVELKLDGAINVANNIVQLNDSTFSWEYTGVFPGGHPINNFQITAIDAVDFYPEGSDTSEIKNTRIIYAFFDENNQDEYLPKDSSFRIIAHPSGGIFTCNTSNIVNYSGFINPGKMLPGEYSIDYEIETTNDSKTLTQGVLVRQPCEINYTNPDQVFWVNSSDWYWIHCNNEDTLVKWLATGGEIIENQGDSVYVEWTQGSAGDFQTKIEAIIGNEDFNYTYCLEQLVAVDNGFAPLKAKIRMEGSATDGYMLFSSVTDTLNYSYEWFKDNDSIHPGWSRPYIFIGSTDIQGTYYVIITDRFSGSYTKSAYYNVSSNNAVKPSEVKENGSHSFNQLH